jgi:uncharacterized membrane protein YkvA (DUF1232 family)
MQPSQYANKEYLSRVLETMKQKMIEVAATTSATSRAASREATTVMATTVIATTVIPFDKIGETIIGVGYILLILVFVTEVFFKTLNHIFVFKNKNTRVP